jgi:hypothetical protein
VGFLVLGWTFAAEHSERVTIHVPYLMDFEVTHWVALLAAFGIGVAVTGTVAVLRAARQGLVARRYRKMIRDLEAEIHQLRNLPLATEAPAAPESPVGEEVPPAPKRALGRGA